MHAAYLQITLQPSTSTSARKYSDTKAKWQELPTARAFVRFWKKATHDGMIGPIHRLVYYDLETKAPSTTEQTASESTKPLMTVSTWIEA